MKRFELPPFSPIVKKLISSLFILFFLSASVEAATVYVTDDIKFTLRRTDSIRGKILKMLPSGTPLTVLEVNDETGYSKVRTNGGVEGYILTRHTSPKPISRWYLDRANEKVAQLQEENKLLKEKLAQIQGDNSQTLDSNQSLTAERDNLSAELNELKQTAANAVQLKHQRDQLQERVISVERELQQVKRENQALEDSTNQDWFLYGGLLALFGVMLGFILPKLSWRRKTSNWDTF